MPLDNVGSQLDLYNTKYTELHLNIYKYKYLKGCIIFTYHSAHRKKVAKFLEGSNEGERESHSVVLNSPRPPWTGAHLASLSVGFSRQEYWSGYPLPSPVDLSGPRIKNWVSHTARRFLTIWVTREAPQKRMATSLSPMSWRSMYFTPTQLPRQKLTSYFPSILTLDTTVNCTKSHFGEYCVS